MLRVASWSRDVDSLLFVAPIPQPKNWDPMQAGQQLLLVDIPIGSKEFDEVERNIKVAPRETYKEVLKVSKKTFMHSVLQYVRLLGFFTSSI